jgi:ATP-dependent Lon protease
LIKFGAGTSIKVKGKDQEVEIFSVKGLDGQFKKSMQPRSGLLGRRTNLSTFTRCLDAVITAAQAGDDSKTREGKIILVDGPPGVGKTALLREFYHEARSAIEVWHGTLL